MRPAHRTAPAPRHRLAAVLTVLLAVLLPLVPTWPTHGAHGAHRTYVGPGGPLPAAATAVPHPATAVPHPALDRHADDGCMPVCAAQTRARHEQQGERPALPDPHAAGAPHGPGLAPGARHRTAAAPGPAPVSPGRASHDSGRAPPAPSGS